MRVWVQPPVLRLPLANVNHSVPGHGQSARQYSNIWAEHLRLAGGPKFTRQIQDTLGKDVVEGFFLI